MVVPSLEGDVDGAWRLEEEGPCGDPAGPGGKALEGGDERAGKRMEEDACGMAKSRRSVLLEGSARRMASGKRAGGQLLDCGNRLAVHFKR